MLLLCLFVFLCLLGNISNDSSHYYDYGGLGIPELPDYNDEKWCWKWVEDTKLYPVRKSHYETYTARCWLSKCVKQRISYYTDYEMRKEKRYTKVCCEGYIENELTGDCDPICDSPCTNGYCSKPNECVCSGPYVLYNGTECRSRCYYEEQCSNANCIDGLCECLPGFYRVDDHNCRLSTCTEGFEKVDDNCEPVCPSGCPHGVCMSPGNCFCYGGGGYTAFNGTCVPICTSDCSNGECIAPEVCKCDEGYKKDTTDTCVPHCKEECSNEEICSEPDICTCKEGYTLTHTGCVPICTYCSSGICIAPESCLCERGFQNPEGQTDRCTQIICTDGCDNGTCVAEDKCICDEGYNYTSGGCYPICESGCFGGDCVSPDNCQCHAGYHNPEGRTDLCNPIVCSDGCDNGTCVEIDKCICDEGYDYAFGGCYPVCDGGCVNGTCVAPGVCKCDDNYTLDDFGFSCLPSCLDGCANGTCIQPNVCVCNERFVLVENKCVECIDLCILNDSLNPSDCEDNCSRCYNGTWSQRDGCHCESGYVAKEFQDNVIYCIYDRIPDSSEEASKYNNRERGSRRPGLYAGVTLSVLLLLLVVVGVLYRHSIHRFVSDRSRRRQQYAPSSRNSTNASVSTHDEQLITI